MTTGKAEGMTGTSEGNFKIKIKIPIWSVLIINAHSVVSNHCMRNNIKAKSV
jgi:hypothetical protein